MTKQFLMGNHVLAQAARDAGAKIMFGYPITPASEILEKWALFCTKSKNLSYLQAEDEMAAGFGMIGSCLLFIPLPAYKNYMTIHLKLLK